MQQVAVNTTQNVQINFVLASMGERILAYLIDEAIKVCYALVVFYLLYSVFGLSNMFDDDWSQGAVMIVFLLPAFLYSLVLESIFQGQTLGKRLLKIRVIKIDGYQASFLDYMMRWVMRMVDIYTNSGLVGLLAMIMSQNTQRIGDMVAGTAVISLKNKFDIKSTILEDLSQTYVPTYPQVVKLSDNDMRIIKEAFHSALKNVDSKTIKKLRTKIEQVTGIKDENVKDVFFIQTVMKDFNYYTKDM